MLLDEAIGQEYAHFHIARQVGDQPAAWRALERLHILTQLLLRPHMRTHMTMLTYAIALRDGREIVGQALRLLLAPVGDILGRLPMGNTGRSTVSVFAPMPIPADLQAILDESRG